MTRTRLFVKFLITISSLATVVSVIGGSVPVEMILVTSWLVTPTSRVGISGACPSIPPIEHGNELLVTGPCKTLFDGWKIADFYGQYSCLVLGAPEYT
eukprot:jgi/Hompol1/147/HPOL_005253-RA